MSYRSEDVQQILQRALARQQDEYTRTQLLEMASELGIEPDVLRQAEQEWLAQRDELYERQLFNAHLRYTWKTHVISYLAISTFLILLNLVATPRYFWSIYLVLGWGVGVLSHSWYVYQTKGTSYEKEFQTWRKKQRSHSEKEIKHRAS